MTKSILLVGVGGQGTILASKILTTGLMEAGYDVKMSEIHGMSQRGGSVSSQVRYGEKVYSPVIEKGKADIIVAFEKMEALRSLDYLKEDGRLVVNDEEIPSMSVIVGDEEYPDDVMEEIQSHVKAKVVGATKLAAELGNEKAANIILLGTIIKSMGLEQIDWNRILEANIKPKFLELNKKALQVGMDAVA
ncbi:MAG TPA: indolepyruvate oxidoreductase subunit beta [Candidatus Blautia avistercoris]|uniref:indolepyruvate oxidoreductase subunit beta n=1 Tax=Blautia sp. An249 TaxID=1965603 RepID=UPI000B397873|nr:indolepyruvate oxidoreductase subunit beta [Blautia sp. An249]OUO76587.1 indolepyruvate oxidoreductase subunit beta [Blautia sp. An249]HIY18103.1 indolepyruvate oxidoreductase subunit beta [Candidatus Blautia avistercoris]